MDAESFTQLVLRVLAGEATVNERRALEAELSTAPARRDEFEQLRITHDLFRVAAPMTEASHATEPALPAYRVNELRTAVRQHFGRAKESYREPEPFRMLFPALRWLLTGGAVTVLGVVIVLMSFSDRSVEVGLYMVDRVRGGDQGLTAENVPSAHLVTFDYDAAFDQWQKQPLAWNQHAKVWVDNEHDLLHIVHRDAQGKSVEETQPLAPTDQAQREQIKQVVESLGKK